MHRGDRLWTGRSTRPHLHQCGGVSAAARRFRPYNSRTNAAISWVAGVDRHFTSTGFLVRDGRVLLVNHRKLRMWLPFGGHIEPGEDPVEALHREAREETGFEIEIVAERPEINQRWLHVLPAPETILLEDIEPDHVHIDLIYFVRPVGGAQRLAASEHTEMRWFDRHALRDPAITDDVRLLGAQAIDRIAHARPLSSVESALERSNQAVAAVDKRFTSSGYLVCDGKVLLLNHRRFQMWLPFGGHIEPNEDPVEALHREAREETGMEIEIVAERPAIDQQGVHVLPAPETLLLHEIGDGHALVDLVYFVRPVNGTVRPSNGEHREVGWFDREALCRPDIRDNVRLLGTQAIDRMEALHDA